MWSSGDPHGESTEPAPTSAPLSSAAVACVHVVVMLLSTRWGLESSGGRKPPFQNASIRLLCRKAHVCGVFLLVGWYWRAQSSAQESDGPRRQKIDSWKWTWREPVSRVSLWFLPLLLFKFLLWLPSAANCDWVVDTKWTLSSPSCSRPGFYHRNIKQINTHIYIYTLINGWMDE